MSAAEVADLIETLVSLDEPRGYGLQGLLDRVRQCEPDVERIDYAHHLLLRRQQYLGEIYPFVITHTFVGRRKPVTGPNNYIDLLTMSPATPMRDAMSGPDIAACAEYFETFSVAVLKSFLGPGAKAIRFAWPSTSGRPPEFPAAVKWLADQMDLKLGSGYRPPRRKDGGVDVIAWRSFEDKRTAFPVFLCQCTVQEDLAAKCSDIDVENWSRWLDLLRAPVTVLLTPSIIDHGETWNELAQRYIILDRLRIARLIGESPPLSLEYRWEKVARWLKAGHGSLADC